MSSFSPRHGIIVALVAVSVGLLAVPALAGASPAVLAPASSSVQWAYGAEWTGHRSGTATIASVTGVYYATAFFGWEAILTQTNTSNSTFQVSVQWTGGEELWVMYCAPDCHSPTLQANLTDHAVETISAVSNFTTDAAVLPSDGAPVPALGLSSAEAHLSANISENSSIHGTGLGLGSHTGVRSLVVHDDETAQASFTPALGLAPLALGSGSVTSWTSTSNYTGIGTWAASFVYNAVSTHGLPSNFSGSLNGSIPAQGNISLHGSATSGAVKLDGGIAATPAYLTVAGGPFTLVDGAVLVPAGGEVIQAHSNGTAKAQAWTMDRSANQTAAPSAVDFALARTAHIGLVASAMTYDSTSSTPSSTTYVQEGATPLASPSYTENATVQGEPESVAAAESGDACIEQGVGCPSGAGAASTIPTLAISVAVVVALGAIVAGLVVERRRRLPPPPHPYSSQYPPGVARPPDSPSGAPAPPGSSPKGPPPPDPLDHLW